MKIAVASDDGVTVSEHFGRSKRFMVFHIEDRKVISQEVRENTYTAHAMGECKGDGQSHHGQAHGHGAIVTALHDCQALVCGGMGFRAANELQANGIRPIVVDLQQSPEQVIQAILEDRLQTSKPFCRCHH